MPTIEIDRRTLTRIVGREIGDAEFEELLFNFKGEVQSRGTSTVAVELNADRVDLMCSAGLGRAFKGFLGLELGFPRYPFAETDFTLDVDTSSLREKRPFMVAYLVKGVRLDEISVRELIDFQERMHQILSGNRLRFAIGVHDVSRLASHRLTYRAVGSSNISFIPLGAEREMNADQILAEHPKGQEFSHLVAGWNSYPLLATDAGEVLSMPPIINGSLTQLTAHSSSLMVDVTGTDLTLVRSAAQLMAFTIAEFGGTIAKILPSGAADVEAAKPANLPEMREMELDCDYLRGILGLPLKKSSIKSLLGRARFDSVSQRGNRIMAKVPLYRLDIMHQVDLIEDVAMMYGYQNIRPEKPYHATDGSLHTITLVTEGARRSLSSLGFIEVNNMLLCASSASFWSQPLDMIRLSNPMSHDMDSLRSSLLPGLLSFLTKNQNRPKPIHIFEVGPVVGIRDGSYVQSYNACALVCDNVATCDIIEDFFAQFCLDIGLTPSFGDRAGDPFLAGRGSIILLPDQRQGRIGEVSPEILRRIGLDYPVACFELELCLPTLRRLTY